MIELSQNLPQYQVAHLDANVFHEVVEYALKECEELSLEKISITLGSNIGDNYLGLIYRAKVYYSRVSGAEKETACLNIIIKCVPITPRNQFLQDMNVFLKEKVVYRDILPRMEAISKGAHKFGARLYHTIRSPITTLFLEDLNMHNYKLVSRQAGLDEVHSLMVLKKLAKFHALSMLLQKQDAEVMNCFRYGFFSERVLKKSDVLLPFYNNMFTTLLSVVSSWSGYEKIAEKLQKYQLNLRDNMLRSAEPKANELKVLNHGDVWINNVLFKYVPDDKSTSPTLLDVVFVDFQMSVWGSPGIDLNYFFNTSVRLDVLQVKRDQLLRAYYESFVATLAEFNWPHIPSFENIQQEVRQREKWGFIAAFGLFPMLCLEADESSDNNLDNLVDEEFLRKKSLIMFQSPKVQKTLKYSLKHFDEEGVFD